MITKCAYIYIKKILDKSQIFFNVVDRARDSRDGRDSRDKSCKDKRREVILINQTMKIDSITIVNEDPISHVKNVTFH